ncbi:uncharacterized protein Fot_26255 [Forsythia ovata]|uniref:Uncharacterized protein n=1 Tax=Forsythia ovata TaxID=205694 RepID=A0ABD1UBG3_9LAMI
MKQSKISRQNILSTFFTEEEIEVAETLLDLGNPVLVSESRNNFSWGCRRKRSTLFAAPSSAPAPSSPSPSIHGTEIESEPQVKVQPSTSPTTPLSFSPSESDEKSKHSSKKSKKRQFILDQMAMGSSSQINDKIHYPFIPMAPSSNGLGNINHVGPVRVPDLNISAEEAFGLDPSQPLDINRDLADKRARFAEARRLRRGIIKIKMMKSGLGGVKPLRSR